MCGRLTQYSGIHDFAAALSVIQGHDRLHSDWPVPERSALVVRYDG